MLDHNDVELAESKGTWKGKPFILTFTGKVVPFDNVTFDCIDIRDIAHSLSQLCRFTGHTNLFYSVAQHSLLVSEKMPGGPAEKLVGLLHDAAEAYTNDLASPLKKYMRNKEMEWEGVINDVYGYLQDSITALIYDKYGVTSIPDDVRLFDQAACVFEAEGFLGLTVESLEHYSFPIALRELWTPWEPVNFASKNSDMEMGRVEVQFLRRFEDLMDQLGRKHDND